MVKDYKGNSIPLPLIFVFAWGLVMFAFWMMALDSQNNYRNGYCTEYSQTIIAMDTLHKQGFTDPEIMASVKNTRYMKSADNVKAFEDAKNYRNYSMISEGGLFKQCEDNFK